MHGAFLSVAFAAVIAAAAGCADPTIPDQQGTGTGASSNMIENHDYEVDLAGVESVNGAPAILTRDNTYAMHGAWSIKVTTTDLDWSGVRPMRLLGPTFPYELFPVTSGTYRFSAWVYGAQAVVGKTMVIGISWRDSLNNRLAFAESRYVLVGGWQQFVVTGSVPPSVVYAATYVSQRPAQGVWDFWFDMPWFGRQ